LHEHSFSFFDDSGATLGVWSRLTNLELYMLQVTVYGLLWTRGPIITSFKFWKFNYSTTGRGCFCAHCCSRV